MQQLVLPRTPLYWTDQRIRSLGLHSKPGPDKARAGEISLGAKNADIAPLKPIEYAPKEKADLQQHAKSGHPLAIHLSLQSLERLVFDLLPFYGVACPVAIVFWGERDQEKTIRGTLETVGLFQSVGAASSIYVLVG